MADDIEPTGTLRIWVEVEVPDTDITIHRGLTQPLRRERVVVVDVTCTRDEAQKLVTLTRDGNPEMVMPATWVGEDTL